MCICTHFLNFSIVNDVYSSSELHEYWHSKSANEDFKILIIFNVVY